MSTSTECSKVREFLAILFDPGQKICVSHNAFGRDVMPVENVDPEHEDYKGLQYFAINAMEHGRLDDNVVCFRNILVENDVVSLTEQLRIVHELGLPYSAITYSGNKSIHFIISLATPLANRKMYDFVVAWIYNVLEPHGFDTKVKNPSRFSRIPGGTNIKYKKGEDGKPTGEVVHCKPQTLLKVLGRVPEDKIEAWLLAHHEAMPKKRVYDPTIPLSEHADPSGLSTWTEYLLREGIHNGKRNEEYFKMAFDFIECGFKCEEAVDYVLKNAKHLGDFPVKELEMTFNSAWKTNVRRAEQ